MADVAPDPELWRALGKLVRGLSALFWGVPATLLIGVGTALLGWLNALSIVPGLVTTGLLLYGLWQFGAFQPQERPWRRALDRTRLVALINFGLSPFLYWWHQMPANLFFTLVAGLVCVTGLLFLFNLNLVIARLGEMLPDETLRQETRQFTWLNRMLLVGLIGLAAVFVFLVRMPHLPEFWLGILVRLQRISQPALLLLVLLPVSLTMALLWKTKEVILDSVFHRHD
ncbi:MAG TPA: hypothetical protein PKN95_04775 [Verrucomicrobiota bacterium]|nr:hypothetical protein [Verrucomicrobiota bacterium]HNT15075.1 hypothetical protein [Verrucomicrobiota bacterium]